MNDSAGVNPTHSILNAIIFHQSKAYDGNIVVHTHRDGGCVHRFESFGNDVHIRNFCEFLCGRIEFGVGIVNAVDVFGKKKRVRADFASTQRRARISREIRIARTARKHNDSALFKVADSLAQNVRLGDF